MKVRISNWACDALALILLLVSLNAWADPQSLDVADYHLALEQKVGVLRGRTVSVALYDAKEASCTSDLSTLMVVTMKTPKSTTQQSITWLGPVVFRLKSPRLALAGDDLTVRWASEQCDSVCHPENCQTKENSAKFKWSTTRQRFEPSKWSGPEMRRLKERHDRLVKAGDWAAAADVLTEFDAIDRNYREDPIFDDALLTTWLTAANEILAGPSHLGVWGDTWLRRFSEKFPCGRGTGVFQVSLVGDEIHVGRCRVRSKEQVKALLLQFADRVQGDDRQPRDPSAAAQLRKEVAAAFSTQQ